eukprot:scaffold19657_cov71-Skeletonema_dohrnii-CCMP3373.AAC.1
MSCLSMSAYKSSCRRHLLPHLRPSYVHLFRSVYYHPNEYATSKSHLPPLASVFNSSWTCGCLQSSLRYYLISSSCVSLCALRKKSGDS